MEKSPPPATKSVKVKLVRPTQKKKTKGKKPKQPTYSSEYETEVEKSPPPKIKKVKLVRRPRKKENGLWASGPSTIPRRPLRRRQAAQPSLSRQAAHPSNKVDCPLPG